MFPAGKLYIEQMIILVSMDTLVSRSSQGMGSVAQFCIFVELLTFCKDIHGCQMFLLPYASALFLSSSVVPVAKAILLISSVYSGVLRGFSFFLLPTRTGKFKTDQNIHPQDFNATPS